MFAYSLVLVLWALLPQSAVQAVDPVLLYTFPQSECESTEGVFTERMGTGINMKRDKAYSTCINSDVAGGGGVQINSCNETLNVLATINPVGEGLFPWDHLNLSVEVWFSVISPIGQDDVHANCLVEASPFTEHHIVSAGNVLDVSLDANSAHMIVETRRFRQYGEYESVIAMDYAQMNLAVLFNKVGMCENYDAGAFMTDQSDGFVPEMQAIGTNTTTVYKLMFSGLDLQSYFYLMGTSGTFEYARVAPIAALYSAAPIRKLIHPSDYIRAGCSSQYNFDIQLAIYKVAIYDKLLTSDEAQASFDTALAS